LSALLSLREVWVEYGDKIVLERVNLDIEAGSFVSIIGPSGAGKSSLLRIILGQEAPTRGTILLDGTPLTPECGPDRGVVFQRYSVFPHLSVLRNTVFGLECAKAPFSARLFGAARRAAMDEAVEMLEAVGLGDSLHLYPAQMSGGMQQRLAIAQALIKRPRILLLDEPFGALDPGIRTDMHALITRLWRDYALTIIMVTHDIREAFALATRVVALDKRRHDPHAPHRFGATAVYDIPLRNKADRTADEEPDTPTNTIASIS
jgi:NitT/TauT family transport system ATP-binding protein